MTKALQTPVSRSDWAVLTKPLVGLPVSLAWRGYGSAVFLELGRLRRVKELLNRQAPRRPARPQGIATVMIEWSWRVERARSIEVGSFSSERRIDAGIARLAGPAIEQIQVVGRLPELAIQLSDGRWVHSFMTADGQPSWTVFLQDGSWLNVGRGQLVHDRQNMRTQRRR